MDIGKIIGKVVATVKDPSLVGLRLFVVQRISQNHEPVGSAIVAVDVDGIAGIGDIVYVGGMQLLPMRIGKSLQT